MAFNVDLFRGMLTGGGARNSHFDIIVTNPIDSSGDLQMKFKAMAASMPPDRIGEIAIPYFGRKIYEAGDREFSEWMVTVINDESFDIKNALERWHGALNHRVGNIRNAGAGISGNSYKSTALVIQYSKSGVPLKAHKFTGIWPRELGEIELGWEMENQFERFQVTFRYDYQEPVDLGTVLTQISSGTI